MKHTHLHIHVHTHTLESKVEVCIIHTSYMYTSPQFSDGRLSLGLPEATFTSCLGGMGMVPACGGEKGPLSEESPDGTAEEERDEGN